MESNVVEEACGACGACGAGAGAGSLAVLQEVQRVYRQRLADTERLPRDRRPQVQVELLRSWVSDLVGQNTLLARAVEELEAEATTRLFLEQRKHSETVCELRAEGAVLRRRLARKESDLRGLLEVLRRLREFDYCDLEGIHFFEVTESDIFGNEQEQQLLAQGDVVPERDKRSVSGKINHLKMVNESLHKENMAKDREIRKLHKDAQQFEQTIMKLTNEISSTKFHTPDVSKKDAEVMAGMCCTGTECGDWEPVKDFNSILREETSGYQERIQKMEASDADVRSLRKESVMLREELHSLRGVCAALSEQCRVAHLRGLFKDDIIREMRRQLKRAKAKDVFCECYDAVSTADAETSTHNVSGAADVEGHTPHVASIQLSAKNPSIYTHESEPEQTVSQQAVQCECDDSADARPALGKHVRLQAPETVERGQEVSELCFSDDGRNMSAPGLGLPCDCDGACDPPHEESVGRSSAADSPSSTCASARAQYYHNKLLSTLQILQNREETVQVQAESLAVAEARIATLTARGNDLKRDIERKGRELQALRLALEETRIKKTDVSITAQIEEMQNQENIVNTLQNNLSVIEDLYRECFYETVKQEDLIEMLRKSYLDVRLMDKQKSDQIRKLHNVISTQKWSLDRCQDIATEVDNLKMEISNFINNSSNDSGMWEESTVGELNEDLQEIVGQLLRLRELLTGDCTCGLDEENKRLKQANDDLVMEIAELRQKTSQLEASLENSNISEQKYQDDIDSLSTELNNIRAQMLALEPTTTEQSTSCDILTSQLNETQALLKDKTEELASVQKQCEMYQETITSMTEKINVCEQIAKENVALNNESSKIAREAARLQLRVRSLELELARARERGDRQDARYRDQACGSAQLQAELEEAQARGAALCAEARHVVRAVAGWARRMRGAHRELVEKVKRKDEELRLLERRLRERDDIATRGHPDPCRPVLSSSSATCSRSRERWPPTLRTSASEMAACSCLSQRNEDSCASGGGAGERRGDDVGTSASEIASCSSTPVPPKRILRKKASCEDRLNVRGGWWSRECCDAAVQRPTRCDVATPRDSDHVTPRDPAARHDTARCDNTPHGATRDCDRETPYRTPCVVLHASAQRDRRLARCESPDEQMFSRLESMSAALLDSYRRWQRSRPPPPHPPTPPHPPQP